MGRMIIKCGVDELRETVLVRIEENEKSLGQVGLDGRSTEALILSLGKQRAALKEEVPRTLEAGTSIEAMLDPVWQVDGQKLPEGRVLALRHPGFGWLTFVIPDHEAKSIADWLTRDLVQPKLN